MKFLLDTNICIYIIRQKPASVLARFNENAVGDIGVSTITVSELSYGVQKSSRIEQNEQALLQFLAPLAVAEFDFAAALAYGQIRAELKSRGTPIGSLDTLIAAHGLALGATVVTNNVGEFSRVPGLRVEKWVGN